MKNNLYKNFVNGIAWAVFDICLLVNDLQFEHLIGLDNSLNIRKMIYNDISKKYDNRIEEEINETILYTFENEFFNTLKIEFEYVDELFHECTIMNKDVCIVNFDNIEKILIFHIKCIHPVMIDFVLIKLALLIGYYQYLIQNNINNEFVDFMNYIISNNKNRLPNSTNIFESVFDEIYEIRKNKVHFGVI